MISYFIDIAFHYYNLDPSNTSDLFDFQYLKFIKACGLNDIALQIGESIKEDHPIYHKIFDKIMKNEALSKEELNHIQMRINEEIIQYKDENNLILEVDRNEEDMLFLMIYESLISLSQKKEVVGHCNLEVCNNIFLIKPGGHPQKYCSNAHKMRAYRERKSKLILV